MGSGLSTDVTGSTARKMIHGVALAVSATAEGIPPLKADGDDHATSAIQDSASEDYGKQKSATESRRMSWPSWWTSMLRATRDANARV